MISDVVVASYVLFMMCFFAPVCFEKRLEGQMKLNALLLLFRRIDYTSIIFDNFESATKLTDTIFHFLFPKKMMYQLFPSLCSFSLITAMQVGRHLAESA